MTEETQAPLQTPLGCGRAGRWASLLLTGSVWAYVALLFLIWVLLRLGGDRWWPATLLLFGPRILFGLPLLVLVPAAVVCSRQLWRPLALAVLVLLFPIMGLCVPWGTLWGRDGPSLTVLTCNIDGRSHDAAALDELIAETRPDFVALQECSGEDKLACLAGLHVVRRGELTIASRWPLQMNDVVSDRIPQHHWPRAILLICTADTPRGPLSFCAVHLSSPRYGLSHPLDRATFISPSRTGLLVEETAKRLRQAKWVASIIERLPRPVVIAGDFNMPVESRIYRDCWSGWRNAFSAAGWGFGHTCWASAGPLTSNQRIDHILCGREMRPLRCHVGPDVGSDHRPVIAELRWPPLPSESE
jgi:vancomycin resistance protein VanJ